MQYELFYLVGESSKPNLEKIKEEAKSIVTKEGGVFVEPQLTKERKMSYKVKNDIRGIYVVQRFNVADKDSEDYNPAIIPNLIKKLNLTPDILRFLLINAAELPELKEKEKEEKLPKAARTEKKPEAKAREIKGIRKETRPAKEEKGTQDDIDKKLEEILKI